MVVDIVVWIVLLVNVHMAVMTKFVIVLSCNPMVHQFFRILELDVMRVDLLRHHYRRNQVRTHTMVILILKVFIPVIFPLMIFTKSLTMGNLLPTKVIV